jgi:hypothetical protein
VADLDRKRGIANVPGTLVPHLTEMVKLPVAVAGLIGLVAAWRRLGARAITVPLALFVVGVATFVAIGIVELALLPRYLTVPAVGLCLFAGYAAFGWLDLPAGGRARRGWMATAGTVAVVSLAVGIPLALPVLERIDRQLAVETGTQRDLAALLEQPAMKRALECGGTITFPSYRLVPNARFLLGRDRRGVAARRYTSPLRRGVAIFLIDADALSRYGFTDGSNPLTNLPEPGFSPLTREGRLSAYSAPCRPRPR